MPVIEYARLAEGDEVLHVIKPAKPGANDNQYVVVFEGPLDWTLVCFTGDWEWQSVSKCMSLAAGLLADPGGPRAKTFAVGSFARSPVLRDSFWVGAKLRMAKNRSSSGEMFGRLTFQLDMTAQEPFVCSQRSRGMDDRMFSLYRTDSEFEHLGRLFQRLVEATFEPVFTSLVNDWFIPHHLLESSSLAELAMIERLTFSSRHITENSPAEFTRFWQIAIGDFELMQSVQCAKCKGFFPRLNDEEWRKMCAGCNHGRTPTAYTRDQVSAAGIVKPWLVGKKDMCQGLDEESSR